ncbi:MAG: hypothetical protein QQN63_00615 [Nitrosopumilus sp.]
MKKLVPICIVLNSREAPDGTMPIQYPNFNQLPMDLRGNMDWSYFIDRKGYGMHYSRHKGTHNKPATCWTLVPRDFAVAASEAFAEVTIHTEEEWADFFDNDAKKSDPVHHIDTEVLQGILARVQLEEMGIGPKPSKELLKRRNDCLDPDCPMPGVNHNHRKTWAQAKVIDEITIV